MGSPSREHASYRYTGDANAATVIEFKPGWQPKKVTIRSAEGEIYWSEGLPSWYGRLAAGAGAFAAGAPELGEHGASWTSVADLLNKAAVEYYVEFWG